MARTPITPQTPHGPYGAVSPGDLLFTLVPADPANGNSLAASGKDLFVAYMGQLQVWNAAQAYAAGDTVQMSSLLPTTFWKCVAANTNVDPTTDNGTSWASYPGESFTIVSCPDAYGRLGDITYTVIPGTIAVFLLEAVGWQQADGTYWVNTTSPYMLLALYPIANI